MTSRDDFEERTVILAKALKQRYDGASLDFAQTQLRAAEGTAGGATWQRIVEHLLRQEG